MIATVRLSPTLLTLAMAPVGTSGNLSVYSRPYGPSSEPGADLTTMLDTLNESFCERRGTRYELGAPEKLTPIRADPNVIDYGRSPWDRRRR